MNSICRAWATAENEAARPRPIRSAGSEDQKDGISHTGVVIRTQDLMIYNKGINQLLRGRESLIDIKCCALA
jgi:hypothetical protein